MNTVESIYLFLTNDRSFRMRSLALSTDMDKVIPCVPAQHAYIYDLTVEIAC